MSFTQPTTPAPAPKPGVPMNPPPPAPGSFLAVPTDAIRPSPFNPRGEASFDKEDLAELAASFAVHGILEPLLLRPATDKSAKIRYELVGGERRWRAAKIAGLAEVPAIVREATDDQAMVVQIIENHQRKDLTPIEEAKGFLALQRRDPKVWTAAAIGRAIGRSDRFVAQRMALVTRLDPVARKALEKGEMSVEKARTLAVAPAAVQKQILENAWDLDSMSADDLREHILQELVPVESAAFDLAQYSGGFHEEGKKRYFTDVAQFMRLQQAAMEKLVRELRTAWPTARVIEDKSTYGWRWADTGDHVGNDEKRRRAAGKFKVAIEKCTAIVWMDRSARVRQAEGVVPSRLLDKVDRASGRTTGSSGEPVARRRSRFDFNDRLVKAAADKPDTGLRAMLVGLIASHEFRTAYDTPAIDRALPLFLPPDLQKIESGMAGTGHDTRAEKAWTIVKAMKIADVHRLLAGYAATGFLWSSSDGGKPKGFNATLAAALKVAPRTVDPAPKKAPAPKTKTKTKKKGKAK